MNAANTVTMIRIALVPVFMLVLALNLPYGKLLALLIFIAASITDGVDGYIARRYNQVTTFGKIIDPLADKLLITSALIMFVEAGLVSSWAAMIVITRELAVTSMRVVAISEGTVIAASVWGKIKTVVQIICIALLLTDFAWTPFFGNITVGSVAIWFMVLVTLWSGIDYFIANRKLIKAK